MKNVLTGDKINKVGSMKDLVKGRLMVLVLTWVLLVKELEIFININFFYY